MTQGWTILLDLVLTLAAAAIIGIVFERFKQSATIGYILAGVLVGPGLLGIIRERAAVEALAELGVVLLMFSIGLEFSLRRLMRLGAAKLTAGLAQILATMAVSIAIALALGVTWKTSIVIGAVIALSSTAITLRVLRDANELDSSHGKASLAILLVQDIAVVPLVLMVAALGEAPESPVEASRGQGLLGLLVAGSLFLAVLLFPRIMRMEGVARNRDLPILLAVVGATSAAWVAHAVGFSPSIGAFVAGLILGESAFSEQIHSDVGALKTLFVTIFFASIGMLADVTWIAQNLLQVIAVALAIVVGKFVVTAGALRITRQPPIVSIATALCLAHIGEFAFLLGGVAMRGRIFDEATFQLFTSASVLTLVLTPYLVTRSPVMARSIAKRLWKSRRLAREEMAASETKKLTGHFIIVGFGDAGQAAFRYVGATAPVMVVELDPVLAAEARERGAVATIGDASQSSLLEHLGLDRARCLIVAVPAYNATRTIVSQARLLAPELPIVARARYHSIGYDLAEAGANVVVDEEELTGDRLGEESLACSRSKKLVVPPPV